MKRKSRGIRPLNEDEERRVIDAALSLGNDYHREVLLMLYCGAHLEEVYRPAGHKWTVNATHVAYKRVKNGRWIRIPRSLLPPEVVTAAGINIARRPYSNNQGHLRIKKIFKLAGLPEGSSLWLRHTYCRKLVRVGVQDAGILKHMLGTDDLYTYSDIIAGIEVDRALEGKRL